MAVVALAVLAFAGSASAATYTPTTFDDTGTTRTDCPANAVESDPVEDCSLREAILAANESTADDEVVLAAGRYTLHTALEISAITSDQAPSGSLLVRGGGARQTAIDAVKDEAPSDRVLIFRQGSSGELRDLAITGGQPDGGDGGAIKVEGFDGQVDAQATLTRVWVHGNEIATGSGGAIDNDGRLTIVQSLLSGNRSGFGSGGAILNDDELTLANSTVSGNESAANNGGGIYNRGSAGESLREGLTAKPIPDGQPFLRVENSTIASNRAAGNGGGVATFIPQSCVTYLNQSECPPRVQASTDGPISRFHNSIVSDNTADGDTNCSGNQPAGSDAWTSSEGHNLEDGDSCLFTASGDLDKASGLAPLADKGGGTDTHKLNDGSAAIDAAESDGCPAVDQRGVTRPQRTACDIGAFERESDPVLEQPQPLPQQQAPEARGPRCLDTQPPITNLDRDGLRVKRNSVTLSGVSHDQGQPCASGVQRVEVSMAKVSGTDLNCRFIRRSNRFVLSPFINCRQPIRFVADGTNQWQFRFRVKLAPGKYRAQARGYDEERNKETPRKRLNIVTFTVR